MRGLMWLFLTIAIASLVALGGLLVWVLIDLTKINLAVGVGAFATFVFAGLLAAAITQELS